MPNDRNNAKLPQNNAELTPQQYLRSIFKNSFQDIIVPDTETRKKVERAMEACNLGYAIGDYPVPNYAGTMTYLLKLVPADREALEKVLNNANSESDGKDKEVTEETE